MDTDKIASVFYTVVIPMLNLLIYSLRNKDLKVAIKKAISAKLCSEWYSVFNQNHIRKDSESWNSGTDRFL